MQAGTRILRDEAIPANPNDLYIHGELAWIYLHKIAGYTDDSNRYYKRRMAFDWTILLGEPPQRAAGLDPREEVIDRYANEWLRPIAEAPDTVETLVERNPTVATVIGRLTELDIAIDSDLIRRYTYHEQLQNSVRRLEIEAGMGPNNRAFGEMLENPDLRPAIDDLINHLRKRAIIDENGMNPWQMIRYTEKHGPIDWRHPAAHALYWSQQGIDRAVLRATESNERNLDFVNTYRRLMQSLQELFRYGDIYFNFIDFALGDRGYYQALPNQYFARSYGAIEREVRERSGIFESTKRVRTTYMAGLENFVTDVILFFYRRGQIEEANYWYEELRTLDRININDVIRTAERFTLPLDDFVKANLYDRADSPNIAANQITAALQGSFVSLLSGQTEAYERQFEYAVRNHEYFHSKQFRDVLAAAGTANRMEIVDPNFFYFAGTLFAIFLDGLDLDNARVLYTNAPASLKRYGYDLLQTKFAERVEELAEAGGDPFEVMFPEPSGMPAFRAQVREYERQRAQRIDGIQAQ